MRITRFPLTTFVVLGIAIVLTLIIITAANANALPQQSAPQHLQGLAPHVRDVTDVRNSFSIPQTQQGTVAFTNNDVRHYINTHPFPLGPTTTGKSPTIVSIEFITSKQARQRLFGEALGVPDTAIVCYVKLKGPFTMSLAPRPPLAKAGPSNTATEIFDAQTGSLLLVRTN